MKTLKDYIYNSIFEADKDNKSEEDSDKAASERADIKFTIWKAPDEKVNWLEDNEQYQKIEYVYNNKEKGIVIDFLLGKKDNSWQLWMGKEGAVNYDDDPTYDMKTPKFADGIVKAIPSGWTVETASA